MPRHLHPLPLVAHLPARPRPLTPEQAPQDAQAVLPKRAVTGWRLQAEQHPGGGGAAAWGLLTSPDSKLKTDLENFSVM